MHGICKLCGSEGTLEESHFIPKFVGKWMKKTSITGFLREKNEVNKRAQDTAKEHWLCGDCEDKLCVWETNFANKIFYPFMNDGKSTVYYSDWLSKFCASLSWRTLTYIRSKNPEKDQSKEYYETIEKAERNLAGYILGTIDNLNEYEQHLFPLGAIESTTSKELPNNINRYFLRTISMDIIGNNTDLMVYTKLPSFMVLGFIKVKEPKKHRTSRIALKSGKISPRDYYWPDGFINYISEKAQEISDVYDKIPKEQQDKIEQYFLTTLRKLRNQKRLRRFSMIMKCLVKMFSGKKSLVRMQTTLRFVCTAQLKR